MILACSHFSTICWGAPCIKALQVRNLDRSTLYCDAGMPVEAAAFSQKLSIDRSSTNFGTYGGLSTLLVVSSAKAVGGSW